MSIYQLINKLCIGLIRDSDCNELSVQSAKRIAFEILLKKSFSEETNDFEKNVEDFQFTQFELLLHKRSKEIDSIEDFIHILKENPNELHSISSLLISLKNIKSSEINEQHGFLQLQTQALQDERKNQYLAHIKLSQDSSQQLHKKSNDRVSFLSNILESYVGNKEKPIENLKLKASEKPNLMVQSSTSEKFEHSFSVSSNKTVQTWESLEESGQDASYKPFCTESTNPHVYQRLKLSSKHKRPESSPEITIIPFPKLLNDIKLLMMGIESETFKRTEALKFYVTIKKVCCENISNLDSMLEKFLEMGTCFIRLKSYTAKNPFNQNQIFEGFIFKAFCDRVIKFLNYSRDIIYSQDAQTFLELFNNTSKIIRIVIHLSKFLNIHPSSTPIQRSIPNGSDFLRLLYNEYTYVLDNNVKCFYIDLLKSCCNVYFIRYQEWLYHGKLDDPYKELFIYYVDRYKENTKHYFDRAYLIRKQSVPEFLSSCADDVLLCGKYTILLKSFNPTHPLFILKKPPFKICLTYEQVIELKEHCREFSKRARQECGDAISISEMLEERRRRKHEKYKNAEIASTKNALKWRQFQEERAKEIREFREAQQEGLRKELEIIEEKKMLKRMTEIQAERDYLDELERIEDEELQKENEVLRARVKIYQELNNKLSDELQEISSTNPAVPTDEIDINANNPTAPKKLNVVKDEMNNVLEAEQSLTEAQRNKIKVLSHEYNFLDAEKDQSNNNTNDNGSNKALTVAQKNKLKIMGHEFGMIEEENKTKNPKINVQDYDKMTDLQKNRLKVLSHEFAIDEKRNDLEDKSQRRNTATCEMTALQRNRKKVLSHEFGFEEWSGMEGNNNNNNNKKDASPKKGRLSLDLLGRLDVTNKQTLESPMSTTSDHFNSENNESLEKSSDSSHGPTKETDEDEERMEMIRAFEEAVEKNQSKFMGLKLNDSADSLLYSSTKPNDIMKMDTMALAEYLQMSLTLPLKSYMEILNNETLKMYVKDLNILSHFKSLRNYFLLMNGEFCSCICHDIFSKIESGAKPAELLNYQSLHMILDHALSNSRYYDPNTENLSFTVQTIPEKFELHSPSILNMLSLSYHLEWPLSLILSPETMEKYRSIFNYLIKLKRITWILEQCFQILKESHKKYGTELLKSEQYRNVQHIRHKMTQFVNCLENYVTRNVIQISWNNFIEDIKSAESILCIYRKHANYLKRILFLCLLNKSYTEFYKNIEDIFKVILKFYKHLKSGKWHISSSTYTHEKYSKMQVDADEFHRLIRFILYLGNKVIQQGYQKEIYDLLNLIDVNAYYSNSD